MDPFQSKDKMQHFRHSTRVFGFTSSRRQKELYVKPWAGKDSYSNDIGNLLHSMCKTGAINRSNAISLFVYFSFPQCFKNLQRNNEIFSFKFLILFCLLCILIRIFGCIPFHRWAQNMTTIEHTCKYTNWEKINPYMDLKQICHRY